MNKEFKKLFPSFVKQEAPNFRPDHYTRATGDFKKALWTAFAVKRLGRLGLKDRVDLELKKAENYLHKARTGEWLSD